jgi:hypothetical protein
MINLSNIEKATELDREFLSDIRENDYKFLVTRLSCRLADACDHRVFLLAEEAKLRAENVTLKAAIEYVIDVWKFTLHTPSSKIIEWIKEAKNIMIAKGGSSL